MAKIIESHKYKRHQSRLRNNQNILTFSKGDNELVDEILKLKTILSDQLFQHDIANENRTRLLIFDFYLLYKNQNFNQKHMIRALIEFRINYQTSYWRGKNTKEKRNPFLQSYIDDLLEAINTMTNKTQTKEGIIHETFKTRLRGPDKFEYVLNNINETTTNEQEVCDVLSTIDNISNFTASVRSGKDINFLVCVNTHLNIDEPTAKDHMLDIKSELDVLISWMMAYKANGFIIINPKSNLFFEMIESFTPENIHYIGHSEATHLVFRKRQRITTDNIIEAYGTKKATYIFLNSCDSSDIAYNLRGTCANQCIGYRHRLDDDVAVIFSNEFYRLLNLLTINSARVVFNQTILNTVSRTSSKTSDYVLYD